MIEPDVPRLHLLSVDEVKSRLEAGEEEVLIGRVSTEMLASSGDDTAVFNAMTRAGEALAAAGLMMASGANGHYDRIVAMKR